MSPRGEEHNQKLRQESRRRLLDAAREAFSELGFHHATMAEIARRAGVAKGLSYRHFESKGALLEALAGERFRDQFEMWEQALERSDPRETLHFAVRQSLQRAAEQPESTRFFLSLLLQPDAVPHLMTAKKRLLPEVERWQERCLALLRDLGREDPESDLLLFSAMLNGLLFTAVTTGALPDHEQVIEGIDRLLSATESPPELPR